MADLATITMTGRLTRDPETTQANKYSVVKFAIAVNGFKKEDVSFFDCEAWGKVSEIVQQYCAKGRSTETASSTTSSIARSSTR